MQNKIYLIHTSKTGKLVLDTELDKQMPPTYKGELCDSVMYFNLPLQGADLTRLYEALQEHAEDQESAESATPENLFPEQPAPEEADISPYFADLIPLAKAFFKGCDQIMVGKSGRSLALQVDALKYLAMLMESVTLSTEPFAQNTRCPEPGVLRYTCMKPSYGTSYDGGCHTSETYGKYMYCTLRKLDFSTYNSDIQEAYEDCELRSVTAHPMYHRISAALRLAPFFGQGYLIGDTVYFENPASVLGYYTIEVTDE